MDKSETSTRERILREAQRQSPVTSSMLARKLGLSRKTVAVHLKKLVEVQKLVKTGATKSAMYHWPRKILKAAMPQAEAPLRLIKNLKTAREDAVLEEMELRLQLPSKLSQNALGIVRYAFTEMFNNAIDHSDSVKAKVCAQVENGRFHFSVRDFGVGLFAHIMKSFSLADPFEAVEHVLKGKQTTQPDRHSGEGLFFTSRIADHFSIRSHRLLLSIDNEKHDFHLKESHYLRGTEIHFDLKRQSRRDLKLLFDAHTNDDYEFSTGEVRVKVSIDAQHISRSEARRLCFGLEKFKRVVFDFQGVKGIGQGFADEIFRVFAHTHPAIDVTFRNAIPPVEHMILRAMKTKGKLH